MKHKRILSLLLALVLVLSLLPVLPAFAANYNIMICGKTVTDANKDDVLGDGSVSFQQIGSSYYLTLKKDISWSNGATLPTIYSTLGDYLYIIVAGDVTVKRTANGGAISHNSLLYISGNGEEDSKLTVIGTSLNNDGAIYSTGEIDIYHANVDVDPKGGQYGIHAGGKLEIKDSTVAAKGSYSAVYGDGGLNLVGNMGVVEPVGGQIFGADIRNADGTRATEVLLAPVVNYDLKVCGKQVTSANAADIMGNGVFEYLPEENFLVVRGNCEHHDSPIIESSIEGLAISVMADSVLTAVDASAIVLHKDTAIGGTGKLTVSGGNAIYADGCELMLYKAKISATGSQYGIRGNGTASLVITETYSKVALQKTEVYAKGGTAAIGGFAGITLSGCYIKTPEDGEAKDGAIVDKDGAIAKEAEIVQGEKPGSTLTNPFEDIKESDYWYTPVLWAYYHTPQVTTGIDKTHFGPNKTCTRGQIVTFLWRAKGCPEPSATESPFDDVQNPKAFYYKAVLWAVEKGVTTGIDKTHFGPDKGCTRGQVVAFLWRAEDKPAHSTKTSPFEDVQNTKAFYYDAVLWAVEKGITKGVDKTHFGPDKTCTRGQIVTFLYRDVVG